MLVREIMTRDPVVVALGDELSDVRHVLDRAGIRCAPVVTPSGSLAGVVSADDLRGEEPVTGPLDASLVRTCIGSISEEDDVTKAAQALLDDPTASILVVCRAGRPIGVVSRRDLLRIFGPRDDREIEKDASSLVAAGLFYARLHRIDIAVERGVVRLTGELADDFDRITIVALVESVPGVTRIDTLGLRVPRTSGAEAAPSHATR